MDKATYTLIIKLEENENVEVGALGTFELDEGFYCYVGSAFGPGGISRIRNHIKISEGEKNRQRWHIDYISSLDSSSIVKIFLSSDKIECEVANSLDLEPVEEFGCSDCDCTSHLYFSKKRELINELKSAFESTSNNFESIKKRNLKERVGES